MSKNSHKQMYEQLMQWIPTAVKKRGRRIKQGNSRMDYMKQKRNG
jgi:hypothetical protein